MALLRYFKKKDSGLPDPAGPLSVKIPSKAIESANKLVEEVESKSSAKRGKYNRFSPKTRAAIGEYSIHHGPTKAARRFTKVLKKQVNESTVRSIEKSYKEEIRRKRRLEENPSVSELPTKKRGRPLLLGESIDRKVQAYVEKIREVDGAVSYKVVLAGAKGIILACNKSMLVEYGGHVMLNKDWARSLLKRMGYVKRKASTSASKHTVQDFEMLKTEFLTAVADIVYMEDIPCELIINCDQTGIPLVPSANWTMEKKGAKRVAISGIDDKRQITAVLCGSMSGDFLPLQVIYKGTTHRCHPKTSLPDDWNVAHSKNNWSNEETTLEYIKEIIIPYVERVRDDVGDKPALLIMDNFRGQSTDAVVALLDANNIHTCFLPPNCTDRLQPMDLSVNKAAKRYLNDKFEAWYAGQVASQLNNHEGEDDVEIEPIKYRLAIMRELGAQWMMGMHEYICNNPQIVVNGFIKAGITDALDNHATQHDDADLSSISSMDLFEAQQLCQSLSSGTDDEGSILAYDTDYDD